MTSPPASGPVPLAIAPPATDPALLARTGARASYWPRCSAGRMTRRGSPPPQRVLRAGDTLAPPARPAGELVDRADRGRRKPRKSESRRRGCKAYVQNDHEDLHFGPSHGRRSRRSGAGRGGPSTPDARPWSASTASPRYRSKLLFLGTLGHSRGSEFVKRDAGLGRKASDLPELPKPGPHCAKQYR